MTINKNEHTDGSASFWQRVLNLIWKRPCPSFLDRPQSRFRVQRHRCAGKKGHKGKHYDELGLRWAYGEEFFGHAK